MRVAGADDRAVRLDAPAAGVVAECAGRVEGERLAAVEGRIDLAVGRVQSHDVAIHVGAAGAFGRRPKSEDDEALGAGAAVHLDVPGGVLGRGLDARIGRVVGVGPAEDDLDLAVGIAPRRRDLARAGAVEAQEVDRLAAVGVHRTHRHEHVAVRQDREGERLLLASDREVDLDEAGAAEGGVRRAVGIEAGDDRLGLFVHGADVAGGVDLLPIGGEVDAAQVVRLLGRDVDDGADVSGPRGARSGERDRGNR